MRNEPIQFLPAELARDTVEALIAEQGRPRPLVLWLILAAVATGLGCLPLVEVDLSVDAPGLVRPEADRVEIHPAVSGHIAAILAHDNEYVEAGQPLLALAAPEVEVRLSRNRDLQSTRRDLIDDLGRLAAEEFAEIPASGSGDSVVFKTPAMRSDRAQIAAQLEANRLEETKARSDFDRYSSLAAKGIASGSELDRARYEVERLQAAGAVIRRQARARWLGRLRDEEDGLADLVSEEKRLGEERTLFTIRASASGMLIGFNGWSVGGFVPAGQVLGSISPRAPLVVDVMVSSRDAGRIAANQDVRLAVDGYPYTQWGTLAGKVSAISGDSLSSGTSPAAFKITIHPTETHLTLANGLSVNLKKGLTVQARFLVARRTLLALLRESTEAWLDPHARKISSSTLPCPACALARHSAWLLKPEIS